MSAARTRDGHRRSAAADLHPCARARRVACSIDVLVLQQEFGAAPHAAPRPSPKPPGAISFWPTIVAGPIELYIKVKGDKLGRGRFWALRALSGAFFLLALGALVGSIYEFAEASKSFRPFGL